MSSASPPAVGSVPASVLVVGYGTTGRSVVSRLVERGSVVIVIDDAPSTAARDAAAAAEVDLLVAPPGAELAEMVASVERVVVSPGVAPDHPVFALAAPGQLISEIELAFGLSTVPIVAVTGTNGKTTVTELVTAMLRNSGRSAIAAGNIGLPLIDAVAEEGLELIVAEVSSFQLKYTASFAPQVATYLNFAEDHLDWHPNLEDYADAKARIFAAQSGDDIAVVNADDPVVMAAARRGRARIVTFGNGGDFQEVDGSLIGPEGEQLIAVEQLPRRFPHDRLNALVALATAAQVGASPEGCRQALRAPFLSPHRVEYVATLAGVAYDDDSKATTPSAAIAALEGLEDVVLIAGGYNKGLDLGAMARYAASRPAGLLRALVSIGAAAEELEGAFASEGPSGLVVRRARSMREAVEVARELAFPDGRVLLSPGCASFDWYQSYGERGDDFKAEVHRLPGGEGERSR